MSNPSIFSRRGFLQSLGVLVGTAVVAPAVLIASEQQPYTKETAIKDKDGWSHHVVTCDRSGAYDFYINGERVINLPPAQPGLRYTITDVSNGAGDITINVTGSLEEPYKESQAEKRCSHG